MYPCQYDSISASVLLIISYFIVSDTTIRWLCSFTKWKFSDVPNHVPYTCSRVIPFAAEPGTGEPWRRHLCCSHISSHGTHGGNSTHRSYSIYLQCTHVSIRAAPHDVRKYCVNSYLSLIFFNLLFLFCPCGFYP